MEGTKIKGIYTSNGNYEEADAFVETTGSTGPMGNCIKYGNGCSMCILRCPSFGPRISISKCAGVEDLHGERLDGTYGAFSGSCKLAKDTIDKNLLHEIEEKGAVVLKVPEEFKNKVNEGIVILSEFESIDKYIESIRKDINSTKLNIEEAKSKSEKVSKLLNEKEKILTDSSNKLNNLNENCPGNQDTLISLKEKLSSTKEKWDKHKEYTSAVEEGQKNTKAS